MLRQRYAAVIKGSQKNTTVYAFGECMKDLSRPDCDVCFSQCKTQILRCSPFQRGIIGGRLFLDGCYVRYDHYYFFNESLTTEDRTVCGTRDFSGDRSVYKANALELVRNLSLEAPKNDGFYVGSLNRRNVSVYGLAQCWKLVNGSACQRCLAEAVTRIESCTPKEEGRVLNAGCYLRYSTQKFYNNSSNIAPQGNQGELVPLLENISFLSVLVDIYVLLSHFRHKFCPCCSFVLSLCNFIIDCQLPSTTLFFDLYLGLIM